MLRNVARIPFPDAIENLPGPRVAVTAFGLLALGFGGCAQSPQQLAAASHGKEYFPSSVYGNASRRVVADGQPIPRGGGQYLVGKPYQIAGQTYYPSEKHIKQVGYASWYGDAFHGRLTANGEIYDRNAFTAAHPTMPLPSYARVTNLQNNYSMIVRVNDRGPYHSNRIMDVSSRVAEALDFKRAGTGRVKVEYVGAASLAGSDDARLYATLRQDGPARWQGESQTMVAEAAPPRARIASIAPYAPSAATVPVRSERTEVRGEETRRERVEPQRRMETLERDAAILKSLRAETQTRELRSEQIGRDERHHSSERASKTLAAAPVLPPSRPLDLGTIPGAASQIGRHHPVGLRMARSHDD